ncbi:hypothetical protein BTO20_28725 [Mycobacterium dioxanotrophicus]|uniref:PE-PPE domain-containing protein n=1 Tax=Mycobacterium dioxanotrophicus TaxID=482462 RepID=A0A1Y0CAE0_9MYCO|nr:hypothetical protein [Mycobacterium dioxanotrophicus]ART72004.1 hypothetical protein BTO20_28725 [Mycobacterium dioxanotrophicus]
MVLSKVSSAATALVCAACIAGAAALPGAEIQADNFAKAVNGNVRLAALTDLAWLDGIPAWQTFLSTGDLSAFVPAPDGTGGYAALSALASYQSFFTTGDISSLGGIDAFSALPNLLSGDFTSQDAFNAIPIYQQLANGDTSNLGDLSSVNALVAFSQVPSEGLKAFVPDPDNPTAHPGYAALSGLYTYQQFIQSGGDVTTLAGIDAFSAIPNWQSFLTTGDITKTGLGGIDAFSALAAITPTPTPLAATQNTTKQEAPQTLTPTVLSKTVDTQAPEVKTPKISNPITTALSNVTPPSFNSGKQDAPEQAPVTPDAPSLPTSNDKSSLPTGKPSNGSYSGVFKPNNGSPILFGTGGGGSADNGIRGWDKVVSGIKGALGGGDSSSSSIGG